VYRITSIYPNKLKVANQQAKQAVITELHRPELLALIVVVKFNEPHYF